MTGNESCYMPPRCPHASMAEMDVPTEDAELRQFMAKLYLSPPGNCTQWKRGSWTRPHPREKSTWRDDGLADAVGQRTKLPVPGRVSSQAQLQMVLWYHTSPTPARRCVLHSPSGADPGNIAQPGSELTSQKLRMCSRSNNCASPSLHPGGKSFLQLRGFWKNPSYNKAKGTGSILSWKRWGCWRSEPSGGRQKGALPVPKMEVEPRETAGEPGNILAQGQISLRPTGSSSVGQASLGRITIHFLKLRELYSLECVHQRIT